MPRCGFSQTVVSLLRSAGIPFQSFDILGDDEIRKGLKVYSQWPTYPQLYARGELVGGCDVLKELAEAGGCMVTQSAECPGSCMSSGRGWGASDVLKEKQFCRTAVCFDEQQTLASTLLFSWLQCKLPLTRGPFRVRLVGSAGSQRLTLVKPYHWQVPLAPCSHIPSCCAAGELGEAVEDALGKPISAITAQKPSIQKQEGSQAATEDVAARIERILASHSTVLFMKGVLLLLLHSKPDVARLIVQQEPACCLLRSPCAAARASAGAKCLRLPACRHTCTAALRIQPEGGRHAAVNTGAL